MIAAAFVLGVACPWRLPSGVALLALGVSVVLAYVGHRAHARLWTVPLVLAALAAGASGVMRGDVEVRPGLYRVEGRVDAVRWGDEPRATLVVERAHALNGGSSSLRDARVGIALDLAVGARVRALVRLRPVVEFHNPSPHPTTQSHLDAWGTLRGEPDVLHEPSSTLESWRRSLRARLDATLPRHAAGVARALLLGDGAAVGDEERDAVRDAGLAHLLAISGLHVALVVGFVTWVVARLARGRTRHALRLAATCGAIAALGFAVMAGGAPSAWRAASMAAIAAALFALHRRPRAVSVVALAAIVFAVLDPLRATSPGFLLSICATGAIVTMRRRESALGTAWVVSTRTTLATAPLVAWYFESVPVLGVVANVVLVPVAAILLLPLAFVHAWMASVGIDVGTAELFTGVLDALVGASQLVAEVGWGTDLPPLSSAQGFALALLAFALLAIRSPRRWCAVLVIGVLVLGALELDLRRREQPRDQLRLTVVDVGQGDGSILDLPDGSVMLIDAGGGIPDPGERAVLPLLRARRRAHVRLAMISHPHPDHYAGLRALLEHVEVDEIWDSGQADDETPHGPAARLLRRARRLGIRVRTPPEICGTHEIGGATIDVSWPCPSFDPGLGPNDNSIVARVRFGQRSLLFTGDVEALAEAELSSMDVAAEVLKVPHHGSRTSSSEAFLRAVDPLRALLSCGRSNRYGHPHPEVVARYEALGIPLNRTDVHGGTILIGSTEGWHEAGGTRVNRRRAGAEGDENRR